MLDALTKITSSPKKRVGRGIGSGKGGHTSGRGTKGNKARQGGKIPLWFEGGQLPLVKRLPYWRGKFHFKSLNNKQVPIKLGDLAKLAGKEVTIETLVSVGLIDSVHTSVKLVAGGNVPAIKEVRGIAVSKSAKEALEKSGVVVY